MIRNITYIVLWPFLQSAMNIIWIIDMLQLAMYPSLIWNFYFVDVWIKVQNGDSHAGDEHISYSSSVTVIGVYLLWNQYNIVYTIHVPSRAIRYAVDKCKG
jgi:hypothetical protein